MKFWLIKSAPSEYRWETFWQEQEVIWDGVRNYQARNYLMQMKKGDKVLFYRSVKKPAVVGIAEVVKEAFPDPTAPKKEAEKWKAVTLRVLKPLRQTVPLKEIRNVPLLQDIRLIKQPRLSVMPLTKEHFFTILQLGNTEL